MSILLRNSCLVLPAVVKQQQEGISRNHVPSLFAVSVRLHSAPATLLLASKYVTLKPSEIQYQLWLWDRKYFWDEPRRRRIRDLCRKLCNAQRGRVSERAR